MVHGQPSSKEASQKKIARNRWESKSRKPMTIAGGRGGHRASVGVQAYSQTNGSDPSSATHKLCDFGASVSHL